MRVFLYIFVGLLISGVAACDAAGDAAKSPAPAKDGPAPARDYMTMHTIKEDFDFVADAVRGAITDRGIKINNTSYIGKMLKRTAEAVGASKEVYKQAQAVEFCSATVSRSTMEADPHNIVFCPYIISIYELAEQPGTVYIAYRKPLLVGDAASQAALKAVGDLLDEIVADAIR